MKLLFYADPHNCDTPPRRRKPTYAQDILDKQAQLIPIARECDLVICGGDVFHQKKPSRVSYELVLSLMEIYREFGVMYIVPGNHDFELNIDEVWSKSPIKLFEYLPNVEIVHSRTLVFDEFVMQVFGGGDYYDHTTLLSAVDKFNKFYVEKHKGLLGVFHASVTHEQLPYDIIPASRLLNTYDALCLGHIHDVQLVNQEIIAPGALSRGVLRLDESLERKVGCAVFEMGGSGVVNSEFRMLDVKAPSEAFFMHTKLAEKEIASASAKLIEFIDSMDVPKAMSEEDLIEYIENMEGIDYTVKQHALRLLRSL